MSPYIDDVNGVFVSLSVGGTSVMCAHAHWNDTRTQGDTSRE